ncbi:MarR family winged helix-turn-helix transcriptional regulator [Streptomyces sp. NPDC051578]|uniref:MarR family winged helix-turn-helix transcriptional regulator n=1 Tax=Streptomyces sp. NPDC051578 TaxID=3365662 RepID=UPI0037A2F3C7
MPRAFPSLSHDQTAHEACALLEMLDVLWGRSQEAAAPVSPSQLRALIVIEQRAGVNLRDLGEALGSAPPSVSRLCDRLEAAGLLERSPARSSRREVELRLSRRGHTALADARALRAHELTKVLERMSPEQQRELAAGLAAFRGAAAAHVGLDVMADSEDRLTETA